MDMSFDEELLYQAIFRRKSVRSYSHGPLDSYALEGIVERTKGLRPQVPGIRTDIRILSGDRVRGMFKVGAPHFLALYSEPGKGYLSNAGFMLQQMDLYFSVNGIGSCWQGGPKPVREARNVSGLEFVSMLAFGPASEVVHRSSPHEFKREPLGMISDVDGQERLLEPARLAPSGMNNQPWFFTGGDGVVHAHSARSPVAGRMNLISTGIALCHMWLAARHQGKDAKVVFEEKGAMSSPAHYSYVASLIMR
jgi:hypothetical protein